MRKLIALFAVFFSAPVAAADIAIGLTEDVVEIDTGFSGARLTLFGAVSGIDNPTETIDIISAIRGPATDYEVRRLERNNLIWMPGETQRIEQAPGLFITSATQSINDIAPLPDQVKFRLDTDHIAINALQSPDPEFSAKQVREFSDAFLTGVEDRGLYKQQIGGIEFIKDSLFAITVNLPDNTPVGDYEVSVFLYRDGVLLGRDDAQLMVNKVGVERQIYELAHERPLSYGLICVVISLFAGWIAAFAFRK